ncbi:MAG: flavoprotein [Lactobacillaceae bacterium]
MEKNVLLCATGSGALLGIAEYMAYLTTKFKHVRVILTKNAEQLMPTTAASQLCEKVYTNDIVFDDKQKNHINIARWADIIIVLPMTANTLGKLANGIADTFMTTILLSYNETVLIYPCMNNLMWKNVLIQKNIKKLEGTNYNVIFGKESESFEIASGKMKNNITIPSLSDFNNDIMNVFEKN